MSGFALGLRAASATLTAPAKTLPLATIAPSARWDGTPSSGFTSPPVDPPRVTAKPVLRLLTPPRVCFADTLLVGVYAGANDGGSLYDTMGLERVTFHYEGGRIDVTEPRYHSFRDANGATVHYFGYWAKLEHSGVHGEGQLYVEAEPRDPSMQGRVIGPFSVFPAAALHDLELEVRADGTGDFTTLAAAATYAKSQGADHPLIRITQSDSYEFGAVAGTYSPAGYCTVEASEPVSLSTDAGAFDAGSLVRFRPFIDRLHLRGNNITVDFAHAHELQIAEGCWFDGCRFTQSRGTYALWRKTTRTALGWLVRNGHYFTECEFTHTYNSLDLCLLARGNRLRDCWSDIFNDAVCVVGNFAERHDSRAYVEQIAALDVRYSGDEANATIAISGSNLLTITYGATTETLQIKATEAAFLANDGYSVQDVADWIDARPGWQANVLDDSRAAWALGVDGGKGLAFSAQDVKERTLRLYTSYDVHADWFQFSNTANLENIVIADNIGIGLVAQNLFMPGTFLADVLIVNNAFHNATDTPDSSNLTSGMGGNRSHFVVAHNTLATQKFRIDNANLAVDTYCLVANNSARALVWQNGVNPSLALTGNHVHAAEATASVSTQSTAGGDETSLYTDAASGDFTPRGELAVQPVPALLRHANGRRKRGGLAAKGAFAA